MTITEREYKTAIHIGNKLLAFKQPQLPLQPHNNMREQFDFELVPFWFAKEETLHIKQILSTYSTFLKLNHERPQNSRTPLQFIGRVARRPENYDKNKQLFETLDLISVYELKCVCEGRTMPLAVQYKVRTKWNVDEGLPTSTRVLKKRFPNDEAALQEELKLAEKKPKLRNKNTIQSPSSPLFHLKPLSIHRSSTLLDLQVDELNNSSCDEASPAAMSQEQSSTRRTFLPPSYLYSLPELGYTEVLGSTQIFKYFVSSTRQHVGYADVQAQAQVRCFLESHLPMVKQDPKDCKFLKNGNENGQNDDEDVEYVDDDASDLLSLDSDDEDEDEITSQHDDDDDQWEDIEDDDDEDADDYEDSQFEVSLHESDHKYEDTDEADNSHLQVLLQCNVIGFSMSEEIEDDDDDDEDYEDSSEKKNGANNGNDEDDEDDEEYEDEEDDDDDDDDEEFEEEELPTHCTLVIVNKSGKVWE